MHADPEAGPTRAGEAGAPVSGAPVSSPSASDDAAAITAASLFGDDTAAPAIDRVPSRVPGASAESELVTAFVDSVETDAPQPEPGLHVPPEPGTPPTPDVVPAPDVVPPTAWADDEHPTTALTWLDPRTVGASPVQGAEPAPALFAGAARRSGRRARVIIPAGIIAALCAGYVGGTLLMPLDNVAPTVQNVQLEVAPAPAATISWPGDGSAAVMVQGMPPAASTTERDEIASISKVVSVLMVLDELPLEVGEQGPSFEFTWADRRDFWSYRRTNQSSLDVPVGGSLTEYQMLQGVLLGSANNYIDRLADELWGSEGFSAAAGRWLSDHGIDGISLFSPSGFDESNVAAPGSLIRLGELAMRNPVFAEIVGTRSAEIPGVGTVTNTNGMLDDEGVIGVKTGTLSHWSLLTAKDVPVGDTTARLITAVLGQESNADRLAVTRSLLAGVEKELAEQPVSVAKGTVVGHVTTEWGERVDVVTDADAKVVLWNGAIAAAAAEIDLGSSTTAGARVGTLTTKGPIDMVETPVSLAEDITDPSIWWRLTHPLELFGLDKD
ncbi:hypothetical protein GCM10022383_14980 [Microbacterium soli]|uniref:D-alanyl-D-alanine carboxypeptidase n=2 Tax=Microbacterium soli TaxID=446075 RepID=A0ABP7N616_9MICO